MLFSISSPLLSRIAAIEEQINFSVLMDNMQEFDHQYTYEDFVKSYTSPVIIHNPINNQNSTVNPYGIIDFLVTRYTYALQQLE